MRLAQPFSHLDQPRPRNRLYIQPATEHLIGVPDLGALRPELRIVSEEFDTVEIKHVLNRLVWLVRY